jgi:hypothetical protein
MPVVMSSTLTSRPILDALRLFCGSSPLADALSLSDGTPAVPRDQRGVLVRVVSSTAGLSEALVVLSIAMLLFPERKWKVEANYGPISTLSGF